MIPDWWEATLLALAAWRVFQLIAFDEITESLRRYVTRAPKGWDGESPIHSREYRDTLALFIQCPYCAGLWITALWVTAWWVFPTETMYAAVIPAVHAGMIGASKILSSE